MRDDRPGLFRLEALAAAGVAAALLSAQLLAASEWTPSGPCAQATSTAVLAGPKEPGERLVVTGTVFAPDGVMPAAGVFLYAYNTDAAGHYNNERGLPPRLRGWMKTGPDGRYEYRTVKPASYPGSRIPAHVHTQLWGAGYPPQEGPELNFEGDRFLTSAAREKSASLGRFTFIRPARRDENGVWRVEHDIRLNASGSRLSGILHGTEPCGVQLRQAEP
jgi:protocatechuate 3,4-dioxygenase beta subunit